MSTPFDPGQKYREEMHGHGAKGMYVYRYRWVDFPRLTMTIRRENRSAPEVRRWFVDGAEVECSREAVTAALEKPHDAVGACQRLADRHPEHREVTLEDGVLVVRGERAERCKLLQVTFPEFEGIPVLWLAPAEGVA